MPRRCLSLVPSDPSRPPASPLAVFFLLLFIVPLGLVVQPMAARAEPVRLAPPSVTLLSPNGGETVTGNAPASVDWVASDESGIASIDLYLSLDDGVRFDPIAFDLPNTPPYTWHPANRPSSQALIRIVATDNTSDSSADESDGTFTIQSPAGGTVPTTLRDFDVPGTQPLTGDELKDPDNCATCHDDYGQPDAEPTFTWQGSMMAHAAIDPLFEACLAIANQDAPDSGDLCLRCHISKAWLSGRSVPTDGTRVLPEDKTGVSCNLCHRLVDPVADPANPPEDTAILAALDQIPTVPGTGAYIVDPNASSRRGPFPDANIRHLTQVSPFHQEAALCGTCHDVSNPAFSHDGNGNFVPNAFDAPAPSFGAGEIMAIERTYSEWLHSEYNTPGGVYAPEFGGNKQYVSTCQDCHMHDITGKGCNDPLAPWRVDLPQHDLTGGSTWMLSVLPVLYPGQLNEAALYEGFLRAQHMLRNSAELSIVRADTQLVVRVVNNTGHKLPTGYPEGRRVWLNVQFLDAGMALLSQSGAYDLVTGVLTHDPEIKIYETEPVTEGIPGVPDGTPFHFVLNNEIARDTRIPPRGFTNASFATFGGQPVGATYGDGQYWDETAYTIPSGAATAVVTLYYQSTSKEYVEFLRDENTTNAKGQAMYDLWNDNGKCPPELMETLTFDLTVVAVADSNVPASATALTQNFPNPFNPRTTIRFSTARPGPVAVTVYDERGREVRRLVDGPMRAGEHAATWTGEDDRGQRVASGVYYYVLRSGDTELRQKMTLVR